MKYLHPIFTWADWDEEAFRREWIDNGMEEVPEFKPEPLVRYLDARQPPVVVSIEDYFAFKAFQEGLLAPKKQATPATILPFRRK